MFSKGLLPLLLFDDQSLLRTSCFEPSRRSYVALQLGPYRDTAIQLTLEDISMVPGCEQPLALSLSKEKHSMKADRRTLARCHGDVVERAKVQVGSGRNEPDGHVRHSLTVDCAAEAVIGANACLAKQGSLPEAVLGVDVTTCQ